MNLSYCKVILYLFFLEKVLSLFLTRLIAFGVAFSVPLLNCLEPHGVEICES